MFEFKHLPEPGGILAQHPTLLERFEYILMEQQEHEQRREKAKSKPPPVPKNA